MKLKIRNSLVVIGISLAVLSTSGCLQDEFDENRTGGFGPGGTADSNSETTSDVVEALLSELCSAAVRCDASLTESGCLSALNGSGHQVWDNFGLLPENSFTTAEVREGIESGQILVNEVSLEDCLHELLEACDNSGESFFIGTYQNVENLILEDGACPSVLESSEGGTL